ncbi:non-canonical purine NTP diphosphatase [Mangrovimonas aestuarii]|uniref:non-canonical purine NTP diphosphatase n=1 Tax=Mangrovimonas aestuarii TaxID=3018443 RepID=UPI0023780917|nr:non-canonical purine NTP diphosphatase [Mangrovimonas aestuarii]
MKIVFATNNQNKVKEVQALMPDSITLLSLKDINCTEDVPETQDTIEGNAIQKVEYIKLNYGYDCFADDTGLEVNSLNGAPGVYSARYAGEQKNANDNMNKLLTELSGKADRSAQFKTVIALHLNDKLHTFTGICLGSITKEKCGAQGFGYDPVFMPEGFKTTFAEMELAEKNAIGHRGKAVSQLVEFLNKA